MSWIVVRRQKSTVVSLDIIALVQNWNDGKVRSSRPTRYIPLAMLVVQKPCPKCIQAEKILNDAGSSFTKIMAEG